MGFLTVFLFFFGIGCALGIIYVLVRYAPKIIVGSVVEGWRRGGERIEEIEAARQARQR